MLISPLEGDWYIGLMSSLLSLLLRKGASDAPLKSQHSAFYWSSRPAMACILHSREFRAFGLPDCSCLSWRTWQTTSHPVSGCDPAFVSRKWGPAGPILLSGPGSCSPVSQSQAYLGTWIAATCHHSLSRFSAWTPLLSVHVRPSMYVSHLCELVLCAIRCLINVCVLNEWSSHDSSHWESLVIVSPPPTIYIVLS